MYPTSDTQRLLHIEQSLIGKRITVDEKEMIPCPLSQWHSKGTYLHLKITPDTEGSFIPAQCKWCKSCFYVAIEKQPSGGQLVTVQSADLSRLPTQERSNLLAASTTT